MADFKLLLVDDEVEFLEPMAARLARRRVSCTTAQNGVEALKILGAEHFDCAVVDVKMPEMDGLELLRRMRWNHPDVPVILLSRNRMRGPYVLKMRTMWESTLW